MFTRLLKMTLIVLSLPAILACSLFSSAPGPSQAEIEKEEQAVYSFFMKNEGTALILKEPSTGVSDDDPQRAIDQLKSQLAGISNTTIQSYVERNTQAEPLSTDMQLGSEYVLLSQVELAQITRQPNWHEILAEKYPGSSGYLIFSRVGFNRTLDQAVIYVGEVAGPLMGSGSYYLLEKQTGEWKVKKEIMVWIS